VRKYAADIVWLAVLVIVLAVAAKAKGQGQCGPNCQGGQCRPQQPAWQQGWQPGQPMTGQRPQQMPRPALPRTFQPAPQQQMAPQQSPLPQATPDPAVVRVTDFRADANFLATGTIIAPRLAGGVHVVTCNHLFRGGPCDVIVTTADGRNFRAQVIKQDDALDLALLWIADPGVEPIPLADSDPAPGEQVWGCGWGDGKYQSIPGQILPGNPKNPWIYCSGMQREGDSGAPLINAKRQLVCCVWGAKDGQRYGARCSAIRKLLERFLPPYQRQPPRPLIPVPESPTVPPGLAGLPSSDALAGQPAAPVVNSPVTPSPVVPAPTQPRPEADRQPGQMETPGPAVPFGNTINGPAGPTGPQDPEAKPSQPVVSDPFPAVLNRIQKVEALLGTVGPLAQGVPALGERIEKVSEAVPGLTTRLGKAEGLLGTLGSQVAQNGGGLADLAAKIGVSSPLLTGGLAALGVSCPVAGIGLWLASRLAKRALSRGKGQSTTVLSSAQFAGTEQTAPTIQTILLPGQQRTENIYVKVPTPDPLEEAKRAAERYIAASDAQAASFFMYRDQLARKTQLPPTQS